MEKPCGLCGLITNRLELIEVFDEKEEQVRLLVCLRCKDIVEGQRCLAEKQVAKTMTEEEYQIGRKFR